MASDAKLQDIGAYLKQFEHDRAIPPLEKWNPQYCGEMDLLIKANGEWWHEGLRIRRQKLIDLFAKVLWKEQDEYFLKTPVEKIKIKVEDAPLLITQVDQIDIEHVQYLQMTTQNGDVVIVDNEHPVFMREYLGEIRPYIRVRYALDALIQRQAFYHLVNYGELVDGAEGTYLKLNSGEKQFVLGVDA